MNELELLAQQAGKLTRQYFGKTIALYAPLYLSNYCENECLYCGFNAGVKIERKKLTPAEINAECETLSATGIQNILLLTGESRAQTPVSYLIESVKIARKYFPNIALEVYPLETTEYQELFQAGADGITIYQETYDRAVYQQVHKFGRKTDFEYRLSAPERIAQAGIRHISMGILLGLADWRKDIVQLFEHLEKMLNEYPGVEYGLSFPRIQDWPGCSFDFKPVNDEEMLEIIARARIRFPRIDINLSTRESAKFRDNILPVGITRLSAGSMTIVGGYSNKEAAQPQFEVNDSRDLTEIKKVLKDKGFDPVLTSWRRII